MLSRAPCGQAQPKIKTLTFRRCLLNKCQDEFQHADRYDAKVRIGKITFIGELFAERIIPEKIMQECLQRYTLNPEP